MKADIGQRAGVGAAASGDVAGHGQREAREVAGVSRHQAQETPSSQAAFGQPILLSVGKFRFCSNAACRAIFS